MATARDLQHKKFKVVAVMGDGAMTGGLAFHALDTAGAASCGRDLLVVLNGHRYVHFQWGGGALSDHPDHITQVPPDEGEEIAPVLGRFSRAPTCRRNCPPPSRSESKALSSPGPCFRRWGL